MPTITRQQKLVELDAHNARMMVRIAQETETAPLRPGGCVAAGEERVLRLIPVIGRGIGGAIPGTRPGGNLR